MGRVLLLLICATALAPSAAWGYYSVSEEVHLEEDGSGRATAVFRLESDDLQTRRGLLAPQQRRDAVPLTRAIAEARCREAGASLSAYRERHNQPGPARPDGTEVAYSEIMVEYAFTRPEAMRPFYPGEVRFCQWSAGQMTMLLDEEETKAIEDVLSSMPEESAPTFFILTEPTRPEAPRVPGLNPRSVDGMQYQSWLTVHLPWRVTHTNGHPLTNDNKTVRWKFPLAGMAHHRMIYLARMSTSPRVEVTLVWVLTGGAVVLLVVTLVWHWRRVRAG